jgi:hypothetical protein
VNIQKTKTLRLASVVTCCGLLFAFAPNALADGTLAGTAQTTQYNPCNGGYPVGTVQFLLVVQTNQTHQGPHVVVHRTFQGTLKDASGNVYQISSVGQTEFDALTTTGYYVLPFENNVVATPSQSLSFTATGTAKVFVDSNQNPTGYSAVLTNTVCK